MPPANFTTTEIAQNKGDRQARSRSPSPAGQKALDLFRAHPIFGGLREEDVRRLSAIAVPVQFSRGQIVFKKGDAGNRLYAIRSGSIKITVPGADGQEAMFNILGEGDLFGEIALLDGQPRTADAVAISDCELLAINRRDFLARLRQEPKVAIMIMELLCARLRVASEHFEDLLFLNGAGRLAKMLLRLPYREMSLSRRRITITQQEISQMIGLSRESTNKQLRTWESRGWLQIVRGGLIVVDGNAIARAAQQSGGR